MDFFNLQSTATKVQKFGLKAAAERADRPPEPPPKPPEPKPIRRKQLFISPPSTDHCVVYPTQQDISSIACYFRDPPVYDVLPICRYKQLILSTIRDNPVTVITAPTGTGKSTRVPQYLMDREYYTEKRHFKIVVTQPRRVAAVALAQRVLAERGLPAIIDSTADSQGTLVGYQIGMDRQVNEDTRLIYMTTGVLLRKLCKAGNLNEYTHIILDEVHERNKETDFLLLLVKKLLCTVSKYVKIVIMSATVNAGKFANYYSSLIGGIPRPSPTITITQESHQVVVFYLDDFRQSIGHIDEYSEVERSPEPLITDGIYDVGAALILSFDDIDRQEQELDLKGPVTHKGSVLVFLPGIFEIECFERALKKDSISKDYDIICLHSSIPRSAQMSVFKKPIPGRRKVILSTNIAESSITVPDIRYVVDFCLTKIMLCEAATGMSSLHCTWAPRSSLDQRKGRAGRVAKGRCYRLVNKEYLAHLPQYTKPEITRTSLEHLVLWCKIMDIGEPQNMLSLALDPPDMGKLQDSVLLLEECGALIRQDRTDPCNGTLTFLGQVMGVLPLDVRLTRLVMFGYVFGCFTECIIIAACLASPAFLETPYQNKTDKLKSYICRMKKAAGTFSDPIMMLHFYNSWYDAHSRGLAASKQFCRDNYIEFSKIQEVASLIAELNSSLTQFNIPHETIQTRQVNYADQSYINKIKLALAGANYPNYFVKDKDGIYEENVMRTFRDKSPADTVMFTGMTLDVRSDDELTVRHHSAVQEYYTQGCDTVRKLSLEGSRLYVTFDNPMEASVCKSVYYAIKMRKLGMSLNLTDSGQDAAQHPDKIPPNYTCNKRTIPIISGGAVVLVTHVISPTKFYVQFVDNHIRSEWEDAQVQLQSAPRDRVPYSMVKCKMYACTHFDDERTLYRVRIDSVRNEQVKVHYLDYGNNSTVSVNTLYVLPRDILAVPFQAIECSLENIEPLNTTFETMSAGGWTVDVNNFVVNCLTDRRFDVKILYVLNSVVYLDIYASGVCLKPLLVDKGHARERQPDFRVLQARKLESVEGIRLDTAFTVLADNYCAPYERPNHLTTRAHLSGATSPYEIGLTGLSDGLQWKTVTVEQCSVNNVVIHHNTAIKYQELVTVNAVALSSDQQRINLRGTTSHQPIPGLAELMTLIFAPKVQLHCSPGKLHYTGCIAGLGVDDRGAAIWPEHDLKLTFDVRVDNEDLDTINKLRLRISDLLRGDEDNPAKLHFTRQPIRQLQRRVMYFISRLMEKRREFLPPAPTQQLLEWGPLDGVRNYSDLQIHKFSGDIYTPHNALCTHPEGVVLESGEMGEVVQRLIEENYKVEEETGLCDNRRVNCELCAASFPSSFSLRAHLNSSEHMAEKARLDHWLPPGTAPSTSRS